VNFGMVGWHSFPLCELEYLWMIRHGWFMPCLNELRLCMCMTLYLFFPMFLFCSVTTSLFWFIFHASYLSHKAVLYTCVVNKVDQRQYIAMSCITIHIYLWPCGIFFFKDQSLLCLISPYFPWIRFFGG